MGRLRKKRLGKLADLKIKNPIKAVAKRHIIEAIIPVRSPCPEEALALKNADSSAVKNML
jgi:hypothetical protein